MRNPVQRLLLCSATNRLYTGIAGKLQTFDARTGQLLAHLSEWEAPPTQVPPASISHKKKSNDEGNSVEMTDNVKGFSGLSPTPKKRRLGGEEEGSSVGKDATLPAPYGSDSAASTPAPVLALTSNIIVDGQTKGGEKRKPGPRSGAVWAEAHRGINSITSIILTKSGNHLVVVSNEDKCVRVFRTPKSNTEQASGILELLSERTMPKRPCAVKLIEGKEGCDEKDTVIICADKFGDVYSLPLFPNPEWKPQKASSEDAKKKEAPVINIARNTKLHNKQALTKKEKLALLKRDSLVNLELRELPFEHKLLLGHVSLLIDVLPAAAEVGGRERSFILTADKDEHIRVSRYPQGYVIEGFCLAHEMFVTRLLIPSWDMRTLISGGGDTYILRWDWLKRKVLEKIELKHHVDAVLSKYTKDDASQGSPDCIDVDIDPTNGGMDRSTEGYDSRKQKLENGNEENAGDDNGDDETNAEEFHLSVIGIWELTIHSHQIAVACERVPALFIYSEIKSGPESVQYQLTKTINLSGNILDATVDKVSKRMWIGLDSKRVFEDTEGSVLVELIDLETLEVITNRDPVAREINKKISGEIEEGVRKKLDEFLYPGKHYKKFEGENEEDR